MRAVVHERYGAPDVLHLEDVDTPTPGDDEVLVKVHATTVNRTDTGFRRPDPWFVRFFSGLRHPKRPVLGSEYAGEVEAVGAKVTELAVGDRVFGVHEGFGAHAEYIVVPERTPVVPIPAGLPYDEATALPDGMILGLYCLKRVQPLEGKRLLVYGASGSIGTSVVQLARHYGAHVTAVCTTKNVDLVRSLGADEVVDYLTDDFTTNGETYDAVIDAVGKLPYRRARGSMTPKGTFLSTDGGYLWQNPLLALLHWPSRGRKVLFTLPKYRKEHLRFLSELVEAGEYRAVVDRRYPLEDVVEATRYVETGQKTGNVVLTVT